MNILLLVVLCRVYHTQIDWSGQTAVLGPVTSWTDDFYASDSVTCQKQGEVAPIAGQINYSNWVSHTIEANAGIGCHSIWPADFDGDGDIDLAGWIGIANQLAFYRNDNGTFTKMNTYAAVGVSYWGFLSGADFNGDGRQDVVVPGGLIDPYTPSSKGVTWYRNDGGFNFTPLPVEPSSGTTSYSRIDCQCDDIDNDGDVDIVVGTVYTWMGSNGNWSRIYKNNGSGTFSLFDSVAGNCWRSKLTDLNGDGYKDLIVGDPFKPRGIVIYFNNGLGNFAYVTSLVNGVDSIDGLGSRDFDNDGDQDITACSNRAYWFENNGTGTSYIQHTIYNGANEFADGACSEDMDMDGKLDVVAGFTKLGWFRQIGPDNFTNYVLDNYIPLSSSTHWVVPIKIKSGCLGGGWDIVVCRVGAFMWYENNMVTGFSTGYLESSVLEVASSTRSFLHFGWETCLPEPNTVAFYWRGDSVSANITSQPWQGPVYAAQEIDSIALPNVPCYKYFQYRTRFLKATVADAPILYKVWLSDTNCLGSGIAENTILTPNLKLKINGTEILLSANTNIDKVNISVFNVAGDFVGTVYSGKIEAKNYRFNPKLSAKGIYLVVLKWNGKTKTAKLVKYN